MTFSEFFAEITTDLSSYSDSNDIDKNSVYLWVINQLRIFGNNVCMLNEKIVNIENSKGTLPKEFKALRLAISLEPMGYHVHGDKSVLQTHDYIIRQYVEDPAFFNEVTQEYVRGCKSKIITEKITVNNTNIDYYYNYGWLSLVRGIDKKVLSADCLNIHPSVRDSYPNEINITGHILNTNFPKGRVYVQYYGLPTDEEGDLIIPEITTGDILAYITNYVKVQIAENIITNNKNPQGLAQLYPVWKQEQRELKRAAIVEAKFAGLSKNWHIKYKILNKREFASYTLPF